VVSRFKTSWKTCVTPVNAEFKFYLTAIQKIPQTYRVERGSGHPLALNRRLFADLVQDLSCGPLRSTFEGMRLETWWTRLEEYRLYALEMHEFIEAEKEAGY
jgi:hypothetical protein